MAFSNAGGMPGLGKGQFDTLLNQIIQTLDLTFAQVQEVQAFFVEHPDADFTAAAGGPGPTGYAAGDVTTMKSAFGDLDQLRTIYQGLATLGTAKDFREFTKLLSTLVH